MTVRFETPALVLERPGVLPHVENVFIDPPGPGEVRVRIAASGICHTDLSAVRDARFSPMILGHEGAGVVESVGDGVAHVRAGDPVMISWRVACGRCWQCARGKQKLCENVQTTRSPRTFRATGERLHVMLNAGTFAEYVVLPADGAIPLRPVISLESAAIIGCAVATGVGAVLHGAHVEAGETVVVFGAGGIGLNIVQGAALARAGMIIAIDLLDEKLRLASTFGATHTFNAQHHDPVPYILDLTKQRGVDHAFEVVGVPAVMAQALACLAQGGCLTFVGAAARNADFAFRPRLFMSRQQVMRGCIYGACHPPVDFPLFVDWYERGALKIDELVTATIGLHDLPEFFKKNNIEVVSSLPSYTQDRTDRQRGDGVFEDSIKALLMLNEAGYGQEGSGLILNLVYNPAGAFLPPSQISLEKEYKEELGKKFGISFNNLYAITNMPISRYLDYLLVSGNYEKYMDKLIAAFNPGAAKSVMCRNTISIGWDGYLYDCDFNQMLDLKVSCSNSTHLSTFNIGSLNEREIVLNQHCYGCTAGAGSSCGGAVAE